MKVDGCKFCERSEFLRIPANHNDHLNCPTCERCELAGCLYNDICHCNICGLIKIEDSNGNISYAGILDSWAENCEGGIRIRHPIKN